MGLRSLLFLFYGLLGLLLFNFEDRIKKSPWILYVFSISTVLIVEVGTHSLLAELNKWPRDVWPLRHGMTWLLITPPFVSYEVWPHVICCLHFLTIKNHNPNKQSDPSIKSDRGQHLQFLRCLSQKCSAIFIQMWKSSLTSQKYWLQCKVLTILSFADCGRGEHRACHLCGDWAVQVRKLLLCIGGCFMRRLLNIKTIINHSIYKTRKI